MGLLSKILSTMSGNNDMKVSEQLLFDKVIGFRNIVPGCGASTLVQNMAIALSEKTKFNICVLDTNFLYPVQYPLLSSSELTSKNPDFLDFSGELSKVVRNTNYQNVYLAQLEHRTVVDMLSGKDTEVGITKFMANLKSYFDVILVDLSNEMTNIAIHSAIKCNRIYQVADTSLKCLYYIKKSINTMVTLGVPLAKANKVIINKELDNVVLGVDAALKDAGLEVIATIPLSNDIAVLGASGKRLYGALSKSRAVTEFNTCIEKILEDALEKTPLNIAYTDVSKELAKMEAAQKSMREHKEEIIEEEYDGDYSEEILEEVEEDVESSGINLNKNDEVE